MVVWGGSKSTTDCHRDSIPIIPHAPRHAGPNPRPAFIITVVVVVLNDSSSPEVECARRPPDLDNCLPLLRSEPAGEVLEGVPPRTKNATARRSGRTTLWATVASIS